MGVENSKIHRTPSTSRAIESRPAKTSEGAIVPKETPTRLTLESILTDKLRGEGSKIFSLPEAFTQAEGALVNVTDGEGFRAHICTDRTLVDSPRVEVSWLDEKNQQTGQIAFVSDGKALKLYSTTFDAEVSPEPLKDWEWQHYIEVWERNAGVLRAPYSLSEGRIPLLLKGDPEVSVADPKIVKLAEKLQSARHDPEMTKKALQRMSVFDKMI